MANPPEDPFDPKTWSQKPTQNNPPSNPQNTPPNPYSQNPYAPNQNPYQQNPPQQQNPYQQNPPPQQQNPFQQNPYLPNQNPFQQVPPWQLQGQIPFNTQRDLPNAGGILALGIISIVGSFCYGIIGLATGIPAIVMGNKAMKDYENSPGMYSESSYNNVKAGRICAIIGLCLSSLFIVGLLFAIIADVSRFNF